MRGPLLPVVLLGLLPALFFAWQLGLLRRRSARWTALLASLGILGWSLPTAGVDFEYLKRLNLFLCGAALLLSLWRHPRFAGGADSRRYRTLLAVLAGVSLVVYTNFFSFHGARTFVHQHDVAHYYLGSKYFGELGYENLYAAMLRAEAEVYGNRLVAREARDLTTNELVDARQLLLHSDEVKAAFAPARWEEFKRDVAHFREALGPQYAGIFVDHGFNPTPLWPLLGGALANLVPAGSASGILALTLIDPLLLALAFAAVVWAFGWDAALLGAIHFCLIFGASFGWTGGAFLRYLWFASLLIAVSCLQRQRHLLAGFLLAVAAGLRVFPAFFVLPILLKAFQSWWSGQGVSRPHRRFLLGCGLSAAGLFLATALAGRGIAAWEEFGSHMRVHVETISPNSVGLTGALSYHHTPPRLTAEEMHAEQARRARIHRLQLATLFAATLAAVALLVPGMDDVAAVVLGVPLVLTGLDLAAYYYVFLVLLVVANRDRPLRLAGLFGLELVSHALLLFEDREYVVYIYRSVLLLYLLAAFYLQPSRERLARIMGRSEDAGVDQVRLPPKIAEGQDRV